MSYDRDKITPQSKKRDEAIRHFRDHPVNDPRAARLQPMTEQLKACPLCHEQVHCVGGVKDRLAHPHNKCELSGQHFSLRVWHLLTRPSPEADALREAREAFLNLLADAVDYHDEPDGDETGDHTRFVIITHWRQMAELAEALGIDGPRYMETWADALDRAIAKPPALARTPAQEGE
jgi:hypothetical protein